MRFEKYTSPMYPVLAAAARKVGVLSLLNRDFVDYYYQGQPWSELHLAIDEDDSCAAFLGFDRLRFEHKGQELFLGMATNFYTLTPGVGGFLWLKWMRTCPNGLVFGGSEYTHQILKKQNFTYYPGINVYAMNARYKSYDSDPMWRKGIKRILRTLTRKPIKKYMSPNLDRQSTSVTVRETQSRDAMPLKANCFAFRFAPTADYLHWRYNSGLGFVRYRWFDIFADGVRAGYCILNDAPQQIIVSYSDGVDPEKLAYGTLKAVFAAAQDDDSNRAALVVSSHPVMQKIFVSQGFHLDLADRPLALGSSRSRLDLEITQRWLINFGLGDNDLRASTFHTDMQGSEHVESAQVK